MNNKPRSAAQIEASCKNGAKSQGPITEQGKRNSSQSAIRHGLTSANNTLLKAEDPAEYKEVVDAFFDELRPATKAEVRLVEKIANLDWRLERLAMMDTALLNMAGGIYAEEILNEFEAIDHIGFIVAAWRKSSSADHCQELMRRYIATLQNQFNATLANFEKLEARRLARRQNDFETYTRPIFDTMEPDTDPEAEPELPQPPNEPKPQSASPVTPIDIKARQPQPTQLPQPDARNEPKPPQT